MLYKSTSSTLQYVTTVFAAMIDGEGAANLMAHGRGEGGGTDLL